MVEVWSVAPLQKRGGTVGSEHSAREAGSAAGASLLIRLFLFTDAGTWQRVVVAKLRHVSCKAATTKLKEVFK